MDIEKTIKNLRANGFAVSYFDTAEQALDYMESEIKGETVGFGGSTTVKQIGLYDRLKKNNRALWFWVDRKERELFPEYTVYICSANAVSETGELINIDGTGNRLSMTMFGPKKMYFVCGKNKIAENLDAAIKRARNVAAPQNAKRIGAKTPCAVTGKCIDCNAPERICRAMVIHMGVLKGFEHTEVVLIGEDLGL